MFTLPIRIRPVIANDRGTALVEYSSLVLLIAIAAIAVLTQAGSTVNNSMGNAPNGFNQAD